MNKRNKKFQNKRTFKKSSVPPRRSVIMGGNGGTSFPSSMSNSDVAASPQSYLPFNNFSSDPGYGVIAARNTGPFLTGVGGKARYSKARKRKSKARTSRRSKGKKMYGGSDVSASISNGLNTSTNSVGIMHSPALNEISGVSGLLSQFSGTGSAYSSTPVNMTRLA